MEMLKDIEGFEGRYRISSWGRVFSVRNDKFLKPEITAKGYLRVNLVNKDGIRRHYKVHRLVANAFIDNPNNKPQVNHIDGNKLNNSITNLEFCTDEENKLHAMKFKRRGA